VAYVTQVEKYYTDRPGVSVSSADLDVFCQTRTDIRLGLKAGIARAGRSGEIAWRSLHILDLGICGSYQRKLV
jgi:hypothetical protein